jgi:hypothetical protein
MPSNNKNRQNKIKAEKAKAQRAKDGVPSKAKDTDAILSAKALAQKQNQHANNERTHRLRVTEARKIAKAGGKTKYEDQKLEKLLASFGMNIKKKKKKKKKETTSSTTH